MYSSKAVETLTAAVLDIIIPKFNAYVELRKTDVTLQKEKDKIIAEIEGFEDVINDLNLPEIVKKDSIRMFGHWFKYNEDRDLFTYGGNKENHATYVVESNHKLYYDWEAVNKLRTLVPAIITTLDETSFDKLVEIVEKQIDFNNIL